MSKIYYGDENNTAVELNIGVSQEYVDGQIEAVSADIHSIPTGGTAGQVLSKVDATDYNTQWIEPPSGSDPDAIKKDGSTTTTATIPFEYGIDTTYIYSDSGRVNIEPSKDVSPFIRMSNRNGNLEIEASNLFLNGTKRTYINPDGNGPGTAGQFLTSKGVYGCEWTDAITTVQTEHMLLTKIGNIVEASTFSHITFTLDSWTSFGNGLYMSTNKPRMYDSIEIPEGFRPLISTYLSIPVGTNKDALMGNIEISIDVSGVITYGEKTKVISAYDTTQTVWIGPGTVIGRWTI